MFKKSQNKTIKIDNEKSIIPEVNSSDKRNELLEVSKSNSDGSHITIPAQATLHIENTIVPSTSRKRKLDSEQVITSQEHTVEKDTEPDFKKICMGHNFWDVQDDVELKVSNEENEFVKINQLQIGNYVNRKLIVRVTYISSVRNTSIGNVINFHGMDETGEICITSFRKNAQNIAKFLKINGVFSISNFNVKEEDLNYLSGTGNTLQVLLSSTPEIEALENEANIPDIVFNFTPLKDIQNLNKNQKIDAIGILFKNKGLDKNYKGTIMRDLILADATKTLVAVTLWTENAQNFSIPNFSTIAIRRGIITEYEGKKKINCVAGTLLWGDSNLTEAVKLKEEFVKMFKKDE